MAGLGALLLIAAASACLAGCAGSSGASGVFTSAGGGNAETGDTTGVSAFAETSPSPIRSAAATETARKLTAGATPGSSAYRIGPLDMLDVSVFKVPDLSKTVQVGDDGDISYPLIGEVPAAGRTTHELERDLAKRLGEKYLRSPQVTVLVREYNSQRVTVEGSVKNSGVYAMKGRTSLVQAIAMAGGIDSTIGSGDVVIFRTIDGKRSVARFDMDAIKKGDAADPDLQPGDVIVADTSSTKVVLHNVLSVLPVATATAVFVPLL
jgi:polysaccharide biosynthesis/export protein